MALEASDRVIYIILVNWRCTCLWMYLKAYLQTQRLFSWHHGKIKWNQPRPQKKIVDLHKSGSSLGAISKCLKVPRLSVQTIVCKYKHHGTTQPSYHSGRRCVLSPRDERTLVRKCKSIPEEQQRTLWRCWSQQVSISTVKRVYRRNRSEEHTSELQSPC